MKILVVHNRYQQRGGEDAVVDNEIRLLRHAGHDVEAFFENNDDIVGVAAKIRTTLRIANNARMIDVVRDLLSGNSFDVVHVHNYFPKISPAVFAMFRNYGVATVHTIHNYRPLCANAMMFREGEICTKCLGAGIGWSIVHSCYRDSFIGSAAVANMISRSKRKVWGEDVDRLIVLSQFAKDLYSSAGFPAQKLTVKGNFARDPGESNSERQRGHYLFVGRLSAEKGVAVLVEAARLGGFDLSIAGSGPEEAALRKTAPPNVTFLGALKPDQVSAAMRSASALIVPSLWFEGFPMVIVEALAHGLPVLASRIGALSEFVEDGVSGCLFTPGDPASIVEAVERFGSLDDGAQGAAARARYRALYSPEASLSALERIYQEAMSSLSSRQSGVGGRS